MELIIFFSLTYFQWCDLNGQRSNQFKHYDISFQDAFLLFLMAVKFNAEQKVLVTRLLQQSKGNYRSQMKCNS